MNRKGIPIPAEVQNWLLDPAEPGPRYLALKQLSESSPAALNQASEAAHEAGPIASVLDQMNPEGYWEEEGPGYRPKYRSTVWSLILLSQLGASIKGDPRVERACSYYLDQAMGADGQISSSGPPSSTIDCLQGNMLTAMVTLGYEDPRLETGYEWMARTVTGEGIAPASDKKAYPRYYAGKYGPDFTCGANNKLACAWGAAKVMLAFSLLEPARRTPLIESAIERGISFLFSCDPVTAAYPTGWSTKPSGNWWKFGFPVFYVTDLLQIYQALVALGYADDPRLDNTRQAILDKQTEAGSWLMEYGYQGKTWEDFGQKKQPNKWVTIRAYRALGSSLADD
jgi:hypothetical protein